MPVTKPRFVINMSSRSSPVVFLGDKDGDNCTAIMGGKAASLHRLVRAGFPFRRVLS